MGKLADLLRWKKEVTLRDKNGKKLETVYLRVIGDNDMQEIYRSARITSADRRKNLRDPESEDYRDNVEPIAEMEKEACVDIIRAAKASNWNAEAISTTVRENEPKIEEIAIDPDAPTLEEQEKLDDAIKSVDTKYEKAIEEYVNTKSLELNTHLDSLEIDNLRDLAREEVSNLLPLGIFLQEVQDQKIYRAVYEDELYKIRAFNSIDEYRNFNSALKEQLIAEYSKLEIGPDDLKN